jgi:hypothetical protein
MTSANRYQKVVARLLAVSVIGSTIVLPTVAMASETGLNAAKPSVAERLVAVRAAAQQVAADAPVHRVQFDDSWVNWSNTFNDAWRNTFGDSSRPS